MPSLLELKHISYTYEGTQLPALKDVSLSCKTGEYLCIVGSNGSGKSTLAQVLGGLILPQTGTITFAGETLVENGSCDAAVYERMRPQVGVIFQNPDEQLVTTVVEEDLAFGPENLALNPQEIALRVERELARVALTSERTSNPLNLSGGQKQRVAIAGALAIEPSLLICDEPASLLDPRGHHALIRVMRRLSDEHHGLVHITHHMDDVVLCDRVIVMHAGMLAFEGRPDQLFAQSEAQLSAWGIEIPFLFDLARRFGISPTSSPRQPYTFTALLSELAAQRTQVLSALELEDNTSNQVGTVQQLDCSLTSQSECFCSEKLYKETPQRTSTELISLEKVSFSYSRRKQAERSVLHDITTSISAGERVAVIGHTGSGKSSLARLLVGLELPYEGTIRVSGKDLQHPKKTAIALQDLCGYVMQFPERQLCGMTVLHDVALGLSGCYAQEEAHERAYAILELLGLAAHANRSPFSLSGGQKRLCALAGTLVLEPQVLVLDEPCAGLDPYTQAQLMDHLGQLHAQGLTLIHITHNMNDVLQADRMLVLDTGRLCIQGTPDQVLNETAIADLQKRGLGLPDTLQALHEAHTYGYHVHAERLPRTLDELCILLDPHQEVPNV